MHEITITISGKAGSGKTTISHLVNKILSENFSDSFIDNLNESYDPKFIKKLDHGIKGLKKVGIKFNIKTEQKDG